MTLESMYGQFYSQYASRVSRVIKYDRKLFIRLATGLNPVHFIITESKPVRLETNCTVILPPTYNEGSLYDSNFNTFFGIVSTSILQVKTRA